MRKLVAILVVILFATNAYGAVASSSIIEVRSTGSDLNGGGFNPLRTRGAGAFRTFGTDYSNQDTPLWETTNLDAYGSAATSQVVATGMFTYAQIGNFMNIRSRISDGGFTDGFYEIIAVYGPNTAVLDRNCTVAGRARCTTASTATCRVGGGLQNLYHLQSTVAAGSTNPIVAGNVIYVKNGTYYRYGASAAILASYVAGGNGTPVRFEGYNTVRGDMPRGTDRPLLDGLGETTMTNIVAPGQGAQNILNFRFANANANVGVNSGGGYVVFQNCSFSGSRTAAGFTNSQVTLLLDCEAFENKTWGFNTTASLSTYINCFSHNNRGGGFNATTSCWFTNCVAIYNDVGGFYGLPSCDGCVAAYNRGPTGGTNGYTITGNTTSPLILTNSISFGNQGWGFARLTTTTAAPIHTDYNLSWANDSGNFTGWQSHAQADNFMSPTFTKTAHNIINKNPLLGNLELGQMTNSLATANIVYLTGSPCIGTGWNPLPSTGPVTTLNYNIGVDQWDHQSYGSGSAN